MISYQKGDICDVSIGVIAHCANCFCTMGAGVALSLKRKFPQCFLADIKTVTGDKTKLGYFSKSVGDPTIYNLYGQYYYGSYRGNSPLDYKALNQALLLMSEDLRIQNYQGKVYLPRLGAGLAGGKWNLIEPMIKYHLRNFDTVIVDLK